MKFIIIVFLILFGYKSILSQVPPYDKNWEVVFSDDFSNFNSSRWLKQNNYDRGGQAQVYTDRPNNVYLDNGNLVLRIDKEYYNCPELYSWKCTQQYHYYTSGEIDSKSSYLYGYFEIYCKLPKGNGFWPSFWLWGGDSNSCWYNEIDIFEMSGDHPKISTTNLHWNFDCTLDLHSVYSEHNCSDFSIAFHNYSLEWLPEKIIWYIDGSIIREEKNIYGINYPQIIVANLALDGKSVDNATPFPSYMYIDYINVYKLKCNCNDIISITNSYDLNNYIHSVKKKIIIQYATNAIKLDIGNNISLRATDEIIIYGDFEIPIGSEFFATTHNCPQ